MSLAISDWSDPLLPPSEEAWKDDALCRDSNPNVFFPDRGKSASAAKRICYSCSVQDKCLEYALESPWIGPGVWGGLTEMERSRLKRRRRDQVYRRKKRDGTQHSP